MKIRTDFVTNSSSSSFSVVIAISDVNGNSYTLEVNPADEYTGGGGEATLQVKEKKIFGAESVDSLLHYLTDQIVFEDGEDYFEELADEMDEEIECEEYSVKAIRKIFKTHKDLYLEIAEEDSDFFYFPKTLQEIDAFCANVKASVPDLGQIASVRIDNIHNAWGEFCDLFDGYLDSIGISLPEEGDSWIEGRTFVVTGKLQYFANREELTELIEENGGSVSGSVSPKTDYLINNDLNSTSTKNQKAHQLGIPIISEQEFIRRFCDAEEVDSDILEAAGEPMDFQARTAALLKERLTADSSCEALAYWWKEYAEPGAYTGKVSTLYDFKSKNVQERITISDIDL